MATIPFPEWIPDAAVLGNPGAPRIVNAVPGSTSYKPIGSFVAVANALDARPRGAIEARDKDGTVFQYAGDAAKLYSLTSATWADVSQVGGYATGDTEVWEFARFKNKILATNYTDDMQQIALGGANFSDLTTAFKARRIAVVRDFVVAGNTSDTTDGVVPDRIRWSAFNDETDWTVSPSTQSDFRDLKGGGPIQKIIGGEFGVIVSEKSTWRMSYAGSPVVFEINEVLPGTGAICSGSVVRLAETVYFLSERGFVGLTNASGVSFPGAGRVDQTVLNDLDESHLHRVSAVADPKGGRIAWAYPGAGNTAGLPNKIVIYDQNFNKWSSVEVDVELLWRSGSIGVTLEGLDAISSSLDALLVSLDSSQWKGGSPQFAAFDSLFQHGFFSGPNMTAIFETQEAELHPGSKTRLVGFRPLVDGGTVTAEVGTRNLQADTVAYGASLSQRESGRFAPRTHARYHRFRLTVSGNWSDVIGIEIDPYDAARGDRR